MKIRQIAALAAALFLALSGCSSDTDEPSSEAKVATAENPIDGSLSCPSAFAAPMAPRLTWQCAHCGDPENLQAANDGDRDSYADLWFPAVATGNGSSATIGHISVRASLPVGLSLPAGQAVGAIFREAEGSNYHQSVSFVTYLGGVQQELFLGTGDASSGANPSDRKWTQTTRLPFDSMELIYTVEGNLGAERTSFRLYELCAG